MKMTINSNTIQVKRLSPNLAEYAVIRYDRQAKVGKIVVSPNDTLEMIIWLVYQELCK